MKIIYSISALSNAGGMERIVTQKANYMADVFGYEVIIVTTEQLGKKPFFPLSPKVRLIDLHVNYQEDANRRNPLFKMIWKGAHKPEHKRKFKQVLFRERPDIVITTFNKDIGFLPSIKDGSKKIAEFHFSHNYKMRETKNRIIKQVQAIRMRIWKKLLSRFDKFVVLTNEDKQLWGNMPNLEVIPNFIPRIPQIHSNIDHKRVIAVGRIAHQKGYDMLVEAWKQIYQEFPDWKLDIYGGEEKKGEKEELQEIIERHHLKSVIHLYNPVSDIEKEYVNSSLFVLSSRYEGLPMVLLEAMSYGLPIVSFACECGPKDIINNTFGTLVPSGDVEALAKALAENMKDPDALKAKGANALRAANSYTADKVMPKWRKLFQRLVIS